MTKVVRDSSKMIGLAPGTLVHIGEKKTTKARISVIDYDEGHFEEKEVESVEECFPFKDKPTVTWINVDGVHEVEIIGKIGEHFGFHPLLMEDIVNTAQRPKTEDYEGNVFVVLKMLSYDESAGRTTSEQVSLILGSNWVISFQEVQGDVFDPVRERIRSGKGRVRKMGADYLAYCLIDSVVDNYFVVMEGLGARIELLEEGLLNNPTSESLQMIHRARRQLILLRKSVWPLRELLNTLTREESPLIEERTRLYFRDTYDHTIQVIETVESLRDVVSGMLDVYLSSVSNRMNEIMKVLTLIATIFIPLTFIAGIYGMNFRHMPELALSWSYPAVLGIMAAIAAAMLIRFRRKRWI